MKKTIVFAPEFEVLYSLKQKGTGHDFGIPSLADQNLKTFF